ncbi:TetR/AcrR family transcriptional regulator [Streptomyces lydicus]|uniref:TetR/AcrR family transcriptional regulator n=1 Tax=Streptomyces lydicus TaxID=47763 RepID=UPI00287001E9|nr:helix-turn-helix domain-containing protein [Streptomyces lydicus]
MERAERAERILEAAEELLLAWGYGRVTIDEIARRAKVGKGTVYLHWRTKDALLLAVVLKVQSRGRQRQLARMRADPLEVLPSRVVSGLFRDFLGEPALRAVYTGDSDTLGRLNDTAKQELAELVVHSERTLCRHLEVLRAHGLVRDDTDVRHQRYTLLAIATGFVTSEALHGEGAPETPEVRAELLARAVHCALETPAGAGRQRAAAAAAPDVITLYEELTELSEQEMRRQLRR